MDNLNASVNDFDPNSRMLLLIPQDLREYANLINEKKVCLIGMGNNFEILEEDNSKSRQTGGSQSTVIID